MQTVASRRASIKYRKSAKGRTKRNRSTEASKLRALRYANSEKGHAAYLKRLFGVDYKDW